MMSLTFRLLGLVLVMSTLAACGGATSTTPAGSGGQPTKPAQPVAPLTVAGTPINAAPAASTPTSTNSTAAKVVPCAQLVPPDELKLILDVNPISANEQVVAGSTTCTWQYTPKNTTQEERFQVQATSGTTTVDIWKSTREAELKNEAPDTVVNSIDGLRDENYTWVSKTSNTRTVCAYRGDKALILRFAPGVLALSTESQIIDYADRLFGRF
jgi:hypothetical protein